MAVYTRRIFRRVGSIASLNNGQIGVESVADADLGYIMHGGKDAGGNPTKWLAKDKPIQVTTAKLTDGSTSGSAGLIRHDTTGLLSGGLITAAQLSALISDYDIGPIDITVGQIVLGDGASGVVGDANFTWDTAKQLFLPVGRILGNQGANVASAADITLGTGNFFDVTGTTTIERILGTDWTAGSVVVLQFASALTISEGVAAGGGYYGFSLPFSANMRVSAGQSVSFVFDGSWWCAIADRVTEKGEMYANDLGQLITIPAVDVYHGLYGLSTGTVAGWTFDAGRVVDADITAESDSGGQLQVQTSSTHSLTTGDIVVLTNMNVGGHNGPTAITVVDTTNFTCDDIAYVSGAGTSSGRVVEPSYLEAGASAVGDYVCHFAVSGETATPSKVFTLGVFVGATNQANMVAPLNSSALALHGGAVSGFLASISEGDRVWGGIMNRTDGTNFTLEFCNMNLHRV